MQDSLPAFWLRACGGGDDYDDDYDDDQVDPVWGCTIGRATGYVRRSIGIITRRQRCPV